MRPAPILLAILAVVAAAMLWGTTGTVQTLMPPEREPLAVGALRLLFGAMALVLLALALRPSRRALVRLPWGGVVLAGAAMGGYNLAFFLAVAKAGVGIGTAIAIGSAPIWATVWEILARRRPHWIRALGQGLAILGVAVLALAAESAIDGAEPGPASDRALGIGLALAAGLSYALYSLVTSAISHRAPSAAIAAGTFSVAAVLSLPVLALVPLAWLTGLEPWLALLFLGVAATGLSYALYTWGLIRVAASTAVTLALAEPVTAWLLASLVVGETMTLAKGAGAVLILAGLVLVATGSLRPPTS